MSDQQLPRDLQAAHQEQAFRDNNPFDANGVGFQGAPKFEPFETGQDYNGLASQGGFSTGVGIGVESGQEGLMRDAMSGIYPNPIHPFPNTAPAEPDITGFDAMRGITYPAIPVSMSGAAMWYDGVHNEFVSFHEVNAQSTGPGSIVE